jgi:electron-transferring-flavoprotein dehydrogenase
MTQDLKRDVLDVDVLFVGGGPASLLGAIHLANQVKAYQQQQELTKVKGVPELKELTIMVIEKGAAFGAHSISGAVLDPIALRQVFPHFLKDGFPIQSEVNPKNEAVYLLTENWAFPSPVLPPSFHNEGNYIVSLGDVVKWLTEKAEATGMIEICPGFPAATPLIEEGKVVGVRCQDAGVNKDGKPKGNFEAGVDIRAKITVFGEGSRGSCTKQVIEHFKLDGAYPPNYALGIKEVWKVSPEQRKNSKLQKGGVLHTAGYPLGLSNFGGTWIYGMDDNHISLGLVIGLDFEDPYLDPHELFQKFKTHPFVKELLAGGELVSYGAKTIPEGGYFARPKPYGDGFLLIGDSAGLINMTRLKGIHLAMQSGIFAAEAILTALRTEDYSAYPLSEYEWSLENSWVKKELWKARYFRQGFHHGFLGGIVNTGIQQALNGWTPFVAKPKTPLKPLTQFLTLIVGASLGVLVFPLLLLTLCLFSGLSYLFTAFAPLQYVFAGVVALKGLALNHFIFKVKPLTNLLLVLPIVALLFATPLFMGILALGDPLYLTLNQAPYCTVLSVLFAALGVVTLHHLRNEFPLGWNYPKNLQESYGLLGFALDLVFSLLDKTGNFVMNIWFEDAPPFKKDHHAYKTLKEFYGDHPPHRIGLTVDNKYLFDKVSDVYVSGTIHEENQPPHLRVQDFDLCKDRCTEEYGNPCQYFCPTAVYEMVEDPEDSEGKNKLFLNFSNCVHCKTCDIKDPYGQIVWWVPEGSGGPNYQKL